MVAVTIFQLKFNLFPFFGRSWNIHFFTPPHSPLNIIPQKPNQSVIDERVEIGMFRREESISTNIIFFVLLAFNKEIYFMFFESFSFVAKKKAHRTVVGWSEWPRWNTNFFSSRENNLLPQKCFLIEKLCVGGNYCRDLPFLTSHLRPKLR